MKSILFFVIMLLAVDGFSQSENVEKTKQMARLEKQRFDAKNSGALSNASNNFVVDYYRCEWKIDPAVRYISGSVTSYFRITVSTSQIIYDLTNQLTVDSIIFRKKKITFSQQANKTLILNFPSELSANKKDSVSVFYHGLPGDSGFGSFVQASHGNNVPVIWTLSEPYGAADWWPCRNGLDDKADSIDIYVIHPSQYRTSSNGILISEIASGNSTRSHYKHRYPIASYLVAIAVTNYSRYVTNISIGNQNLPVIQYIYPEDLAMFQNNTFIVLNALQLYSNNFGVYPFIKERYGQTEFGWGGGMEHQTNSFVTSAGDILMAHELGHQWFGDKVTCGSWQDIWLNEGFATYLADIFYTEKIDTPYYRAYVEGDLGYIVSEKGGSVWVPDTTNSSRIFDSRLSYAKGAFLLRMLRWTLGDSVFFRGINQYLTDPKLSYGFARTADLQRNLENVSGLNLNYFFNQWFYGEGYPSFTVQWTQDSVSRKVHFTVSEKTSVPLSVSFFRAALPVQLIRGSHKKTVVLQCRYNNQQFEIADPGFIVNKIIIDPDLYLISNNNKAVKTALLPTANTNKFIVRPNPVTDLATVLLQNMTGKTELRLFNGTGVELWNKIIDIKDQPLQVQIPFASYPRGKYRLIANEENGAHYSATIIK
jgi:aminopeptidase N